MLIDLWYEFNNSLSPQYKSQVRPRKCYW